MRLQLLFCDQSLLVIDKPAGLLSVPGKGPDRQDCVARRVQREYGDALVVHRLDCHTSGVMLMARGKAAQAALSRQFHDRQVDKAYIAVVHGRVAQDEGIIDLPMRCDIDNRPRQIIDFEHGKRAITRWRRLAGNARQSRLLLLPVTGRSHQLRVHCRALGHAIVGDSLYGDAEDAGLPRMLLHAQRLCVTHPVSGERLCFEAPCDF